MAKKFRILSLLMTLMLSLAGLTFGQERTGTIEGVLTDSAGSVVPGVTVTVTGVSIGYNRVVTSGDDGSFFVREVPPGTYKISTTAEKGFGGVNTETVVSVGKASRVDLTLSATAGSIDVNVTSGAEVGAAIDTSTSAVQTNINARTAELLPKGENFTSVLRLSPSTRAEANSGGFQVDGASGSENAFVIDGQEVSNFRTGTLNGNNNVPNSFVQEVQVKTSGFNAEFGGATGGVISVVTKGGTNDFHGEAGIDFEPSKLQAGPRQFLTRRTPTGGTPIAQYFRPGRDSFNNVYPSGTLGGRIIKDRLWFFGTYSPQFYTVKRTVNYFSAGTLAQTATETYKYEQRNEYAFGRLDAAPTNNLRLTASYTWNPIIIDGNLPAGTNGANGNGISVGTGNISIGGAPPSAAFGGTLGTLTGRQLTDIQGGRQNANNFSSQAVWTPSSNASVSARFSRGFLNEKSAAYGIPNFTRFQCADNQNTGLPGGAVSAAEAGCSTGFQNITNNFQNFGDVSVRKNFEADMTYYVSSFLGRHQFKGGYQLTKINNEVNQGYKNTGRVLLYYGYTIEDLTGEVFTPSADSIGAGILRRFATAGKANNKAQAIYIQDSWQPSRRLTLNLGVRAEKEDLPSFNGFAPPINFSFGDKVVPRLGASFDLFGDGKTKLYGTYAQFTDRLRFELPRGSFGGDFFRDDYFELTRSRGTRFDAYTFSRILGTNSDVLGGRCPITNSTGFTRCQFDFRIASNDPNGSIFTGQVDPDLKPFRQEEISVGIEREIGGHYLLTGRYLRKDVKDAVEDAGFPTPQGSEAYIIGNPGSGLHAATARQFGYTKVAKPQRQYDAMQLTLERRLENNYYFNVNYTYSRLYGNYSGLASSDEAGRTSPGVNRFFDLPFVGFTAAGRPDNGRLATDRPHVFNAYGAYIYDWAGKKLNSTEIGFFTTAQSGTPVTSFFTLYQVSTILSGRGDLGRTEALTQTDLSLSHKYRFGSSERYTMAFDVNVSNIFNEANVRSVYNILNAPGINIGDSQLGVTDEVTGINRLLNTGVLSTVQASLTGTRKDQRYGLADGYQTGRFIRFGFRFLF